MTTTVPSIPASPPRPSFLARLFLYTLVVPLELLFPSKRRPLVTELLWCRWRLAWLRFRIRWRGYSGE